MTSIQPSSDESVALPYDGKANGYHSRSSMSEVMAIIIAFHGSAFRTFNAFYTHHLLKDWHPPFSHLVSYSRVVELMPWGVRPLDCFLQTTFGELTGISFIDSTCLEVCHPNRAMQHKVLKEQTSWGKGSVKWYFDLKLLLITNDKGALFTTLYQQGLTLMTKRRQNMTNRFMAVLNNVLLRKQANLESINEQLKNICHIEHTHHRSGANFLANLLSSLIAYSYHPTQPALNLTPKDLETLSMAIR